MTPVRTSNTEFMAELMDFSRTGAMAQLFIMDAVQKHAERVASTPIADLRTAFGSHGLISPEAWQAAAAEIAEAFADRLKAGQP